MLKVTCHPNPLPSVWYWRQATLSNVHPQAAVTGSNLCRSWGSGNMPLPCSIDSKSIMTPQNLSYRSGHSWIIFTEGIYYLCADSTNLHGRGRGKATNIPCLKSHKQQNAITSQNSSEATKMVAFSAEFLPDRASLFVKSGSTEESLKLLVLLGRGSIDS